MHQLQHPQQATKGELQLPEGASAAGGLRLQLHPTVRRLEKRDFLALYVDAKTTLKVQLKGRPAISKKHAGKGLHMAFPVGGQWYLVRHHKLVDIVRKEKEKGKIPWDKRGTVGFVRTPKWLLKKIQRYQLWNSRVDLR